MANRLVSVDDNLNLPPAVQEKLTSNVRTEFLTSLNSAQSAATAAASSATAANTSRTQAAASAQTAQDAAASILVPTAQLVDERINAAGVVRRDTLVYNIKDFGAVGNNTADDTPAIQAAVNAAAGGGTVLFPKGTYYMAGVVQMPSNVTLSGYGATVTKTGASAPTSGGFFWVSSGSTPGYGAGAKNINVFGLRFLGSFTQGRVGAPFPMHHADNVLVRDCTFEQIMGGGHVFDLCGCRYVTIENCQFIGCDPAPDRLYTEAVQIDSSTARSMSITESSSASYDGLPTTDVIVRDCRFLPVTVGSTTYRAPNPIGNHLMVNQRYLERILFENNYVQDALVDTASAYNGWIHFTGVRNLTIRANTFVQTGTPVEVSAINIYRGAHSIAQAEVGNPSAPAELRTTPSPPTSIRVESNRFVNWNKAEAGGFLILVSGDTDNGFGARVDIVRNFFEDCRGTTHINLTNIDSVNVSENETTNAWKFLIMTRVRGFTVSNNTQLANDSGGASSPADGGGVRLLTCEAGTISGNSFRLVKDPIWVSTGSIRITIVGNTMHTKAGSAQGIYFTATQGGTISGNYVSAENNTVTRGIYISNGATNCAVIGNSAIGPFGTTHIAQSGSTNVQILAGANATV